MNTFHYKVDISKAYLDYAEDLGCVVFGKIQGARRTTITIRRDVDGVMFKLETDLMHTDLPIHLECAESEFLQAKADLLEALQNA